MSHIQHKCKTACLNSMQSYLPYFACVNSVQSYLPYLTKRFPTGKTEILYINEIQ